jgi:hypothetical protein
MAKLNKDQKWELNQVRNDLMYFAKDIAACKANDDAHKTQILENLCTLLPTYVDRLARVINPEDYEN